VTGAVINHYRVRVFKTGSDFLDPMILEHASGQPVDTLDLFMGGEAHCRERLWQAAGDADLMLIEGVMGLFDGQPCSTPSPGGQGEDISNCQLSDPPLEFFPLIP
jgi:cobyrinic acid a,c-diamide synthase